MRLREKNNYRQLRMKERGKDSRKYLVLKGQKLQKE